MIVVQLQRLASIRGLFFGPRGTMITGDPQLHRGHLHTETTSHYGDALAGTIDDSTAEGTVAK